MLTQRLLFSPRADARVPRGLLLLTGPIDQKNARVPFFGCIEPSGIPRAAFSFGHSPTFVVHAEVFSLCRHHKMGFPPSLSSAKHRLYVP